MRLLFKNRSAGCGLLLFALASLMYAAKPERRTAPAHANAAAKASAKTPRSRRSRKAVPPAQPAPKKLNSAGWHGAANLGYSMGTGNTTSRSFTGNLDATYRHSDHARWVSLVKATALLAHSSTTGLTIVSNTFSGGLREDRKLDKWNYLFALAQYDYIQPEGIHLRQSYGGGYGRELVLRPRLHLSGLVGLNYVHTRFIASPFLPAGTPLTQNSAELLLGENLMWNPSRRLTLTHDLNFYPNLSQSGQYRFDTNTTLAAPITSRIALTASFVDFYISDPLPGNHTNNATLATGLGLKF